MSGKSAKSSKDSEAGSGDDSKPGTTPPLAELKFRQYPADDKPGKILDILDRNRASGEFCDVQLKLSESRTVYAHKAILCACSPYFEGMFTSTFMEATSDIVDMSHTTENPDVLESLVNSFYGHKFEINEENSGEVLNLATMLLIDDLREICGRVMKKTVGVRNAAEMLQLAFNFQIEDLKQLVLPILRSRFHDYVMHQEDLVEMGTDCFDFLLKNVNTHNVSRKADYIRLILNWFSNSENDERARVAINSIQFKMSFKITKKDYREVEKDVAEVIEHLGEVNSDVSSDMRGKFLLALEALKPADYDPDEAYDSELEDVPVEVYTTGRKVFIGPRTEQEGYTEEEEKEWKEHGKDVIEFNAWDKRWGELIDQRNKMKPRPSIFDENPEMKECRKNLDKVRRRHDKVREEFKKRNFKFKSPLELKAEESIRLDAFVVLVPGTDLLDSDGKMKEEDGVTNDEMFICAFVPKKHAWYKLGTLKASGLAGCGEAVGRSGAGGSSGHARYGPEEMEDMMHMYGPDVPEMMMMMEMEDMPGRHRRRMMEHMARRHGPHGHRMHRMMDMDEDDDMPGHPMMMMMMRDRGMMGFGGRSSCITSKDWVKTLLKGKWKMVILNQKLYFLNKDCAEAIWSYDLMEQTWKYHRFNPRGKSRESGYIDGVEAVEIIVMGQTLYLVVLIVMNDTRNDFFANRSRSESDTRDVKTRIKVLRFNEDGRFEDHYESESHDVYVSKSQFGEQREKDKESKYTYEAPTPMKKGVLKMVLYREDDEKLDVFLMQRSDYKDTQAFTIAYMLILYLDLKEEDHEIDVPHTYPFVREMTPLMTDDMLAIVSDELETQAFVNLASAGTMRRCSEMARSKLDNTCFLEAEALYPVCETLLANDGRRLWILKGGDRDISECKEMTSTGVQRYFNRQLRMNLLPPPPFRRFTMSCPGQIDRFFLRRCYPPTKYLHA